MAKSKTVEQAYKIAREQYAALGVDTDAALKKLRAVPISLHCWQGDDVGGFEKFGAELGGGLAATGNYPGKARTPAELRSDAEKAFSLIPGKHRFNLHAFYGDFAGKKVDRNEIAPEHFVEREGGAALSRTAGEAMNAQPRTIGGAELAAKALAVLEERKITSLVVVDAEDKVEGVLHLHDMWGVELI